MSLSSAQSSHTTCRFQSQTCYKESPCQRTTDDKVKPTPADLEDPTKTERTRNQTTGSFREKTSDSKGQDQTYSKTREQTSNTKGQTTDQIIDQTKDGGGRHRNKYQKRGQEANQVLSATAQHLLSLRKTLKIASTSYHNAAIQENLLQSYWDREITLKGLKISKPCVAFKKAESEIEEQFKDILHDAEVGLHCSLMQHLGEVARKCKQVVKTTECEMATAAEIANTTEVITHERFLSATRHNINKSKGLKHHRACNKLNEVSGRRERFRSSRFYQLVENTSLNRPEHQRHYPMGAIPTTTKSDTPS